MFPPPPSLSPTDARFHLCRTLPSFPGARKYGRKKEAGRYYGNPITFTLTEQMIRIGKGQKVSRNFSKRFLQQQR